MTCRVIVEAEPRSGAWNMAIDEALLDSAASETGVCTLRWYRWERPTVSLGYFQPPDEIDPRFADLDKVRRLTGGGAILHDREWTYSVTLPRSHHLAVRAEDLYEAVHRAVIDVLQTHAIDARLRGSAKPAAEGEFLCFHRGDPRDVVLDGHKIMGSAQRRRKGAILQHGSLLLELSPHAVEFPGIQDLRPATHIDATSGELATRVAEILDESKQVSYPGELTDLERGAAFELLARYA